MEKEIELKGLIFDYGQVIARQDKMKIREMALILNLSAADFQRVYFKYRGDYDLASLSSEQYWEKVISFCNINLSDEKIKRLMEIDVESWISPDEEMVAFIKYIRPSVEKLGIISNMPFPILREMEKRLDFLSIFDSLVFSCNLSVIKPEVGIYRKSLEEINLEAKDCLFVDDSEVNIKGAWNLGFNTIQYRNFKGFKDELERYRFA